MHARKMDGVTIEGLLKKDGWSYEFFGGAYSYNDFPESPPLHHFFLVNSAPSTDELGVSQYANVCSKSICAVCHQFSFCSVIRNIGLL